ncbi:Proteasome subunit beta type-5 [Hypoxylon texense]
MQLQQLPDPFGPSVRQWAQYNNDGWRLPDFTDNTTTIWPVLDAATSQVPADLTSWQSSELSQHNYFASTEASTVLGSSNFDVAVNDSVSDNNDYFGSENPTQCDEGAPGAIPPALPTLESRDPICLNEDLYDACFGVVTFENFQLQNNFFNGKAAKEVSLEVNGTLVIIKDANSDEYGGLLDQSSARVMINLIKDHNVEISASIKTPKRIEALIYGWLRESAYVGDMLLEQGCFLQQPDTYDATRPYHNPQCLLHPNEEIEPPRVDVEISTVQGTCLNENEQSKVTELLDSATGPSTFRRVEISDILVTELKSHQKKALSMMIEKEAGCTRDAKFPSVWVESPEADPSDAR